MTKICVISPKACSKSAKELAVALNAAYVNPYDAGRSDFRDYDVVYNYGCGYSGLRAKRFINPPASVANCVNKVSTFRILKAEGVPIPDYTTKRVEAVAKGWDMTVVRQKVDGKQGQDCTYVEKNKAIPEGVLFTEYFEHDVECRIIVYKGKIVARFLKDDRGADCVFVHVSRTGFKAIDAACIKAANALHIDYTGFDVLVKRDDKSFVILEANSGPILHDEVRDAIIKDLLK